MTAKYQDGAAFATQDDFTPTNAGCGRVKSNSKSANNLDVNFMGEEYSQLVTEAIATQVVLGRVRSTPGIYGDADLQGVNEIQRFLTKRWDRASAIDHFTCQIGAGIYFGDINTASGFTTVAGGIGVTQVVCGVGLREGWYQNFDHWYQRSSYFRAIWMIDTIPVGAADVFQIGIVRYATHYVHFICTNPSAPTVWTVEINDGGAIGTDVLTIAPDAATWHTFEIMTDATGADFWFDREFANYEHVRVNQAPENGFAHPLVSVTSAAGGQAFIADFIGIADTRPL
jgi:hypothetical protein